MQFNDIYLYLNHQSSTPTEEQLTQAQSLIVNLERKSVNTIIEKEDNSELSSLLSKLQKDDLVVAFEAATLSNSIQDLQKIVNQISKVGAHLIISNLGLSTLAFTTPIKSSSAISTKASKVGRHLSHTQEEFEYYFNQVQSKEKSVTDICKEMKISRNTYYELKKRYITNQEESTTAPDDRFNLLREQIRLPDLPEELKLNEELVPVRQDNLIEESCVQESLRLAVEDNSEPVPSVSSEDDDIFSDDEYNDIINTTDADNYNEANASIDEYDYIATVPTDEDNDSYMSKVESTTVDSDDDFDLSDFESSLQLQPRQEHNCDFSIVDTNEQVILADSDDRSRDYNSDDKPRRSWFSLFR